MFGDMTTIKFSHTMIVRLLRYEEKDVNPIAEIFINLVSIARKYFFRKLLLRSSNIISATTPGVDYSPARASISCSIDPDHVDTVKPLI